MLNENLIALFQPTPSPFQALEWRDACERIKDLEVNPHRFVFRASLEPGLYRGRIETLPGAFDMATAMIPMTRVPDGKKFPIGPWDLNHFKDVMALPSAKAWCNGRLLGALWFNVPGPDQIAEGRLSADFGFEVEADGEIELVLEFLEHDRSRISWNGVKSITLRQDDRRLIPLEPLAHGIQRLYFTENDLPQLRETARQNPWVESARKGLLDGTFPWNALRANGFDLGCLIWLLTEDAEIGERARALIVKLCDRPDWSGRRDPLIMGGENDRGLGLALYDCAIAWAWLRPLFSEAERAAILSKMERYLRTIYDFTVLQCGYMGQPTIDPHSLGTWYAVGIACMSFYDDLPVARKILPFFHGLMVDSLRLFPPGGKASWVTYFPSHTIRYLAAASVFGGPKPEISESPFLDHLGEALLACFANPNTQELQRGLRTVEHRMLTSFLNRFHPSPASAATYWTFVAQEEKTAGDIYPTIFDLLYAPADRVPPIPFPDRPFFAPDIGQIVFCFPRPGPAVGLVLACGHAVGARNRFSIKSHNREVNPGVASIELSWESKPLLNSINIASYGRFGENNNSMGFSEGYYRTDGQYLAGEEDAEKCPFLRRALITEEVIYLDTILTPVMAEKLQLRYAQRIILIDLRQGRLLVRDSFAADRPLTVQSNLNTLGSITKLEENGYRLTGGQSNLLSGKKFGDLGLSDDEFGEIFVSVIEGATKTAITVEEPYWFPGYIYRLNRNDQDLFEDARYPRYQRWRLHAQEAARTGELQYLLSLRNEKAVLNKNGIGFDDGLEASFKISEGQRLFGFTLQAESVISHRSDRWIVAAGLTKISSASGEIEFRVPVDLQARIDETGLTATAYTPSSLPITASRGAEIGNVQTTRGARNTHAPWKIALRLPN